MPKADPNTPPLHRSVYADTPYADPPIRFPSTANWQLTLATGGFEELLTIHVFA
jgi:hypothetical protein